MKSTFLTLNAISSLEKVQSVSHQEKIVFIGNTQSGKSTLINYLSKTPLEAFIEDDLDPEYFIKTINSNEEIQIGSGVSKTFFPYVKKDPIQNLYYIDTPGNADMRGQDYNIVHSFSIGNLFNNASNLKICFVISQSDLKQPFKNFIESLNYVGNIFPKFEQVKLGILPVITKTTNNINQEKLSNHFKKLNNNEEIKQNLNLGAKNFLNYLAENNTLLSTFPKPIREGYIDEIHRNEISKNISELSFISKPDIKLPNPYDPSKKINFVEIKNIMHENCTKDLKHNVKELQSICRDKIHFTNTDILLKMFNSLSRIFNSNGRKKITKETIEEFLTEYELTQSFDSSNIENSQKCLKLNVFSENHSSIVNKIYDHVLKVSDNLSKITHFMGKTSGLFGMFKSPNGIVTIKSGLISTGYIKKLVKTYKEEEVKSIIVKNKHTFFINEDLVLHGKNLVVSSSLWEIKNNHKIDLSGKNGYSNYSYKASNGSRTGENGTDGLPGKPGQHSGHFYGQGKEIICYSTDSKLILELNGGNGENGQDGGNGKDGLNGKNATNSSHATRHTELLEDLVAENKILATYIKYGNNGQNGGNAGMGGKGGKGGLKGKFTLNFDNRYDNFITIKTQNGREGKNGKVGEIGKGGKHGHNLISKRIEYETNSFTKGLSGIMREGDEASLPIQPIHEGSSEQEVRNAALSVLFAGTLVLDVVTLRPIHAIVNCFRNEEWQCLDQINTRGYAKDGNIPSILNSKGQIFYPQNTNNLMENIESLGETYIPDEYNI